MELLHVQYDFWMYQWINDKNNITQTPSSPQKNKIKIKKIEKQQQNNPQQS